MSRHRERMRNPGDYNAFAGGAYEITFGTSSGWTGDPKDMMPAERIVCTMGERALVYGYHTRAYYDRAPIHGRTYLGKFNGDREAKARWRGWLRSQGASA